MTDIVLMDFHHVKASMTEVMHAVSLFKLEYPNCEIFMDGDRFAIVAREVVA